MNYEYCPPISKGTICFWSVKIKANFSCCLKHYTDFGENWMYDHHRDFCRRNFLDPQQMWNEMVSWCWDVTLQALPSARLPAVWLVFQQSPWNWEDYSCAWYSPCAQCPAGPGRRWEVARVMSLLSIVSLTPLQNGKLDLCVTNAM